MSRFADLIDFALCAGLVAVSLAAMTWVYAEMIAFGSESSRTTAANAALVALGLLPC